MILFKVEQLHVTKNEYKIIKGIDEWFDNTIREKLDFQGEPAVYKSGKYRGQPMHYDREEEYVKGLRNILKRFSFKRFNTTCFIWKIRF